MSPTTYREGQVIEHEGETPPPATSPAKPAPEPAPPARAPRVRAPKAPAKTPAVKKAETQRRTRVATKRRK